MIKARSKLISTRMCSRFWPATASVAMGPTRRCARRGCGSTWRSRRSQSGPGHPDAIVPGHPEQSELIKRIESKDPHHLMPQSPQGEAKPMKAAEIAVLQRVDQGGRGLSAALGL